MKDQTTIQHRQRMRILSLTAALLLFCGSFCIASAQSVIPVGRAVGIRIAADGALIVRVNAVQTEQGEVTPAKQAGLQEGDILERADGKAITSNADLQQAIQEADGHEMTCTILRNGEEMSVKVQPAKSATGSYLLGVVVRDSMAGVGTITYVDPATGVFGALGHGISDPETGVMLPLQSGDICPASISGIKRGAAGEPGELHGEYKVETLIGLLKDNTTVGIFGTLTDASWLAEQQTVKTATPEEVQTGNAEIISNISGIESKRYDVKITRISRDVDCAGRNMMLQVTDPELIARTGGIVQGMSGSPILQNGKLVGAVTHVLVNEPTSGYGIFIDRMLAQAAA